MKLEYKDTINEETLYVRLSYDPRDGYFTAALEESAGQWSYDVHSPIAALVHLLAGTNTYFDPKFDLTEITKKKPDLVCSAWPEPLLWMNTEAGKRSMSVESLISEAVNVGSVRVRPAD